MKTHCIFNAFKRVTGVLALVLVSANSLAASVAVHHPYARAVPSGQPNSAAFMVLKNVSTADRALVDAQSSVSNVVELHTHKKEGGMMRMRRVKQIDINAGSKVILKPGGLHVMFIGLKKQLSEGDVVDLVLVFDDGERVSLNIPVKRVAGMKHKKPMH